MAVQIGYTCPGASNLYDAVCRPQNYYIVYCIEVPSVATDVTLFLNLTSLFFAGFNSSTSPPKKSADMDPYGENPECSEIYLIFVGGIM